jgi:hypothetical protein
VFAVTTEQLVGAHAGQQDLDACFASGLAHEHGIDCGRVADRLVKDIYHTGKHVDHVRADLDLVQLDPQVCRHLACVDGVVRHGLEPLVLRPERDGVSLDGGVPVRGHRGDQA